MEQIQKRKQKRREPTTEELIESLHEDHEREVSENTKRKLASAAEFLERTEGSNE